MAQVNKYADRAAYTADAKRLSTKSAVSFIENETTTIYDGVNTVVGKSAAAIGDLAVFDKTDGVIKYIKSATIAKAQIPANLVPLAVVYARQGEQLLIVSLDHVSGSIRWAHTYEVALSGFDLEARFRPCRRRGVDSVYRRRNARGCCIGYQRETQRWDTQLLLDGLWGMGGDCGGQFRRDGFEHV